MTSPLQQKIRITGPSVVTANRTWDGAVIYRTGQQGWSARLSDAAVVRTSDAARALLAESVADDVGAVGAYIAPVEISDTGEIGQLRVDEFQIRIAPARFGEQALGRIEPCGRISIRIQPGHLAAAAAADIGGGAALDEETPDDVLQIDRRRLLVPLLRKRRRILVIGS